MHDSYPDKQCRRALIEIYQAAIQAVNGHNAVRQRLTTLPLEGAVNLIAVGKAAQSMTDGAKAVLGDRIVQGLVISKVGHLDSIDDCKPGWQLLEGGHPVPNSGSLLAGERLIEFLARKDHASLIFLISGGISSLVEYPVRGIDQDIVIKVNDWLLCSGLAIEAINLVRKAMSQIKGGGLLCWIGDRPVRALAISDVPGDIPGIIGSGLLVDEPELLTELYNLVLPDWLKIPLEKGIKQRGSLQIIGPEVDWA